MFQSRSSQPPRAWRFLASRTPASNASGATPGTSRALNWVLVGGLALVLAAPMTGCGPKKKAKEVRAEKGDERLVELMSERRARLVATMPTSDEPDGSDHPWLQWMGALAGTVNRSELKKVGVIARGTATAGTADALATWLDSEKKFYFEQNAIDRKEYWRDVNLAHTASEGKPWAMDLEFQRIFFHAAEVARTPGLFAGNPTDDRVTRFFTYWTLAFDYKAKTGILEDETNELCTTKLAGYCDPIPMELRPFQVMRPYYQKIVAMIAEFRAAHPASAYGPFLARLDAVYAKRIAEVPEWVELPKLATMRSTVSAPVNNNAVMWVTDDFVAVMDNALRRADDAEHPWKPTWSPDSELSGLVSQLVEDVRSSTASNFNQSQILVVPQPNVPVRYLEPLLRATVVGEHAKEWPTMILVGRRRSDNTNRRVGFRISVLEASKAIAFKLGVPGDKGKRSCEAWAVVGAQLFEAKGFGPAVFHDGKTVSVGKRATDGTLRDAIAEKGHGDGPRLEAWADRQNQSIVVAVQRDVTYADLIEAMNGVALACENDECKKVRTQPVFIATCD